MPCQKFESMKFSSTLVGTMLKMLLNIEVQMSLLFSHNQQIKKTLTPNSVIHTNGSCQLGLLIDDNRQSNLIRVILELIKLLKGGQYGFM